MNKRLFLFTLLTLALTFGCKNSNKEFSLSKDQYLTDYNLISPFFIEQLNEAPVKTFSGWNDSLIKLVRLKMITVTAHGMKNPEAAAEDFIFHFNKSGEIMAFEQKKYEQGASLFTSIEYRMNSAMIKMHFGKSVNQQLLFAKDKSHSIQVWQRTAQHHDTTEVFGTIQHPEIILQRSGGRISRINFVLKENQPVVLIKTKLENIGVSNADLVYAEKLITYVDEHYRPLRSYEINDDLIQTHRVAEWRYKQHKKLIGYTRFINNSPLKEYSFEYNEDKLLTSFICNRVRYSVNYK